MVQIPIPDQPVDGQRLSPEQWDSLKSETLARAREARSQVLRDFLAWLAQRAGALVRQSRDVYSAWRNRRAAVRELQGLDNRMLRDMGIARSEIEWLVAGGEESRAAQSRGAAVRKTRLAQGTARRPASAVHKRAA